MKICIDLGGTNIRIAAVENNEIIKKEVFKTNVQEPKENLKSLYDFVNSLDEKIFKVYICCPGPLNETNDMIIHSPNLPGWNDYPFKTEIEKNLDVEVIIINDANAATLGEASRYEKYDNILYFTISTGFGGGFSQKQKIYSGETNTAFEIKDYIITKPTNILYGNLKGLEDFCSGTGIYKLGLENDLNISSAKDVFELASQGNEIAINILSFVKETIVIFLKNMCYVINPGAIVLGGSVVLNNKQFFNDIKNSFYEEEDVLTNKTLLELADENGESGLLGLIYLGN